MQVVFNGHKMVVVEVLVVVVVLIHKIPLPSNRHHRSNDDFLEGKRKNCQVCSVQYCVHQLCTV